MKLASFWSKLTAGMRRVVRKLISAREEMASSRMDSYSHAGGAEAVAALSLLVAAVDIRQRNFTRQNQVLSGTA